MAAFELFAGQGYAQTSVESIAVKAKISKGLIYHYFHGKEDILKGLFTLLQLETRELLSGSQGLSPQEFLKKLFDFSIGYITNHTKVNRLMLAMTLQPDVIKGLKKDIEKLRDVWMTMMIDLFKELKYENPEAEAYLLGAIFDGMSIGYLALDGYPLDILKDLLEKRYGLRSVKTL